MRSVARARCSELLTATTLESSATAVSLAGQSSTSRATSTARCRGGSRSAASSASSSVSRCTSAASGSVSGSVGSSPRGRSRTAVSPPAASRSRERRASASSAALVAIRYSQARTGPRPAKVPRMRQARRKVSCVTSSASWCEPTRSYAWASSSRRWRANSSAKPVESPMTAEATGVGRCGSATAVLMPPTVRAAPPCPRRGAHRHRSLILRGRPLRAAAPDQASAPASASAAVSRVRLVMPSLR